MLCHQGNSKSSTSACATQVSCKLSQGLSCNVGVPPSWEKPGPPLLERLLGDTQRGLQAQAHTTPGFQAAGTSAIGCCGHCKLPLKGSHVILIEP